MGDNKRTPSPNSNISNSTINDKITESPDKHCYNGINNKNLRYSNISNLQINTNLHK